MHRFYLPETHLENSNLLEILSPTEIHHVKNVLRLKINDQIVIFTGKGKEAVANIVEITAQRIKVRVDYVLPAAVSKKTAIILACAIPKKSKFEFIIEKCTELDVDEIHPVLTERTIVRLSERNNQKKGRYQTIAINAAKQSHRIIMPVIHPIVDFRQFIQTLTLQRSDAAFIPTLIGERKSLREALTLLSHPKKIIFFIGPEGDFTPMELNSAVNKGFLPVSLGPTVLKVDTAAISAVALANLYFND